MTRNVYIGADIQRPVRATAGLTGNAALVALGNANHELREIVDDTNFPVRAGLLAEEIARTHPDLVGLQEVALWRSGPVQLDQIGVPNASTVDYDYLAILLGKLAARGAHYVAAHEQTESDVEAPSFLGDPFVGTMSDASDQRLTTRDVILKRVGSPVQVTGSGGSHYDAALTLPIAGQPTSFVRGYNWVDAHAGGASFRFVNTHLEAFSSDIALAQADQLLVDLAALSPRTTIIACDCNSDPLDSSVKPFDTVSHKAPYEFIVGSGFTDQWLQWAHAEEGWTSGLSETVDDSTADRFDHRIDMVFAQSSTGSALPVVRATVTGDEVSDRDPATGLWPSDHAGVLMKLRMLR
ncbi:MAG: hypothetical protein GEU93_13205 [Propionibacteriales bacterium]|nr:hypothetical protein [Propionibacteriales bacterium]